MLWSSIFGSIYVVDSSVLDLLKTNQIELVMEQMGTLEQCLKSNSFMSCLTTLPPIGITEKHLDSVVSTSQLARIDTDGSTCHRLKKRETIMVCASALLISGGGFILYLANNETHLPAVLLFTFIMGSIGIVLGFQILISFLVNYLIKFRNNRRLRQSIRRLNNMPMGVPHSGDNTDFDRTVLTVDDLPPRLPNDHLDLHVSSVPASLDGDSEYESAQSSSSDEFASPLSNE